MPPLKLLPLSSDDLVRFWSKVDRGESDTCWHWTGSFDDQGYGRMGVRTDRGRRPMQAHRVSLVIAGVDPSGRTVDHRCHTEDPSCIRGPQCLHRRCVNPAHLDLVTRGENGRRAGTRLAYCLAGLHARTPGNLGTNSGSGAHYCIPCNRTYQRQRRAATRPLISTCPNGHPLTEENRDRNNRCRPCARERNRRYRARAGGEAPTTATPTLF